MSIVFFFFLLEDVVILFFFLPRLQAESSSHELHHKALQHSGKDHLRWLCCLLCQTKEPDWYIGQFLHLFISISQWNLDTFLKYVKYLLCIIDWLTHYVAFRYFPQEGPGANGNRYISVRWRKYDKNCTRNNVKLLKKHTCATHLILISVCSFFGFSLSRALWAPEGNLWKRKSDIFQHL